MLSFAGCFDFITAADILLIAVVVVVVIPLPPFPFANTIGMTQTDPDPQSGRVYVSAKNGFFPCQCDECVGRTEACDVQWNALNLMAFILRTKHEMPIISCQHNANSDGFHAMPLRAI